MEWRAGLLLVLIIHATYSSIIYTDSADRDALICLYKQTGGPAWLNSCGWSNTSLLSDPCCASECANGTWYGVTCSQTNGAARVVGVELSANGLKNAPAAAAFSFTALQVLDLSLNTRLVVNLNNLFAVNLPLTSLNLAQVYGIQGWNNARFPVSLTYLEMSNNELSGSIPTWLGSLVNLQTLILDGNSFTGPIPPIFSSLQSLQYLDLGANLLNGTLPENVCEASALQYLKLTGNNLGGCVPGCLASLKNIQHLGLGFNQFTAVSDAIWSSQSLQFLSLLINNIEAPLPTNINLPSLQQLLINLNYFTGTLPDFTGSPNISEINVARNLLSGSIPETLCQLPLLSSLLLDHNAFVGDIPACLGSVPDLQILSLGGSNLTTVDDSLEFLCTNEHLYQLQLLDLKYLNGSIPACWSHTNLSQIIIQTTGLSGTIPPQLFFLNLTVLVFDSNALNGSIPEQIANVSSTLIELVLPNNQLTGTLPSSLVMMTALQFLDLSNNDFSGNFPQGWDAFSTPITHADFHESGIELIDSEGALVLPTFWSITENCETIGLLTYLDMSGLPLEGYSLDALLISMMSGYSQIQDCPGGVTSQLGVLRLARMGLSSISAYILAIVNSLVVLDISSNNMGGVLPAAYIPTTLVTWDASSNNFIGGLPPIIGDSLVTTLVELDLTNNPLLGFPSTGCTNYSSCLPDFLAPSSTATTQYLDFFCLGVTDVIKTTSAVKVDPTFFNYELCQCNPGMYGNPSFRCNSTQSLCTIANGDCYNSTVTKPDMSVFPLFNDEYYPLPNVWNVTQFVTCRSTDFKVTDDCQASNLLCVVDSNYSMVCHGSPCNVGRTGRICSLCADGYFLNASHHCSPCPQTWSEVPTMAWFAAGLAIFFIISLIGVLVTEKHPKDQSPACYACHEFMGYFWAFSVVSIALIVCNAAALWEAAVTLVMLVCVMGTYVLQKKHQPGEEVDRNAPHYLQANVFPLAVGLIKSQIVFAQQLVSIGGGIYMGGFKRALTASTFLGQAIVNQPQACYIPQLRSYPYVSIVFLADPLVFDAVVFLILLAGIVRAFIREKFWRGPTSRHKFYHTAKGMIETAVAITMHYLNLVFFQATTAFCTYFSCVADSSTPGDEDNFYNSLNPDTKCFTSDWWQTAYGAIALYGAYMLVSVLIMYRISTARRRLHDSSVRRLYGFFYGSYHFRYWYYDAIVFLRRVSIGAVAGFMSMGAEMQSFWETFLFLVFLIIHVVVQPFRIPVVNVLEIMNLLCLTIVGVMYTYSLGNNELQLTPLVVTLISVVVSLYVLVAVLMLGGALVYYHSDRRKASSRPWQMLDWWLGPTHHTVPAHNELRGPVDDYTERTPLVRPTPASDTELQQLVGLLPKGDPATEYLDKAMRLPSGSAERETAIVSAFRQVATAGLSQRSNRLRDTDA